MTRLRAIAPLVVAAALTAVAFATAKGAGCDDPARYELRGNAYYDTPAGRLKFPVTVYSNR